ncbi:MAG TPA: ABC transporter [Lachnospiraceae bacterium]|nr:ABC transporter [Lachnospiraceae bacterium]
MPMYIVQVFSVFLSIVIFCVPFYFIIVNSLKNHAEAGLMSISAPDNLNLINYMEVIKAEDYAVLRGFRNSTVITLFSVCILAVVCSMLGYIMQRRNDKVTGALNFFVLTGLMIPPAIVPTIWIMQGVHVFKTLHGMILVEVALHLSFCTIMYRGAMASIPHEIDDAAIIDGCGSIRLFFSIIFPLLRSITSTVIIISSVGIFNDFVNPLFFLPGKENVTVQTTLYQFTGMYFNQWHYLFADVVIITVPPFVLFLFFNKRIISGMVAGAVKG